MNGKILYTKVYNRKNQTNKEGKAPIEICACLNGKRRYFSTRIFISPKDWDAKHKQCKTTTQTNIKYNKAIASFIERLENAELTAAQNGAFGLSVLDAATAPQVDKTDFLAFVSRQIEEKRGVTLATRTAYQQLLKNLTEWRAAVTFADLTYSFIESFENYLLGRGLMQNSVNCNLRTLRAMINSAINNGLLDANRYPFRNYRIRSVQTTRAHLTAEEIKRLETLELENPKLQTIKDMYLFAVYTGLRFSDVERITPRNIISTGGKTYLTLTMQKTARPLNLPIYALFGGRAIEIINRYKTGDQKPIFPKFYNGNLNRLLRTIADRAEINKRLTFHTARHTAATYLLNAGVNIVIVQYILGHTNVSTTQIYAKMLGATIEKELQNVDFGAK